MNLKPEQIPGEAASLALEAYDRSFKSGHDFSINHMKAALAAALPVLLGEPVAFINKRELTWIPRWGGPGSAVLSNKQTGKLVALYTLPTQDTPNEQ